jgi:hypothetical protein
MNFQRSVLLTALATALVLVACGPREDAISFKADVKPILDQHCLECHTPDAEGYEASELSVATYDDLMAGTSHGPVVVPGDAFNSNLNILVEGRADPSIQMPHGEQKLFKGDIEKLRGWVDQGALDN